jgi:hypothetical protein
MRLPRGRSPTFVHRTSSNFKLGSQIADFSGVSCEHKLALLSVTNGERPVPLNPYGASPHHENPGSVTRTCTNINLIATFRWRKTCVLKWCAVSIHASGHNLIKDNVLHTTYCLDTFYIPSLFYTTSTMLLLFDILYQIGSSPYLNSQSDGPSIVRLIAGIHMESAILVENLGKGSDIRVGSVHG